MRPARHSVRASTRAQNTLRSPSAINGIVGSSSSCSAAAGVASSAVAPFQFLYSWNDFFAPLLYLVENPDLWTLSIGLSEFRGQFHVEWNLTMAASVLFMLPVIILFFLAQRVFVEGVTLTGVKG